MKVEKKLNDDTKYPSLKGHVIRKYWNGSTLLTIESGSKFKYRMHPILCSLPTIPAIFIDRKEAAEILLHWKKQ